MSDAPERIALRWTEGAAVASGPLMDHPDYTRYVRADRIEGLEELLWAAENDAKEAEAYAEEIYAHAKELETKLAKAMKTLECYAGYWADDKTFIRTDDGGELASETIKELTSSEAATKEGGNDE